MNQLYGSGEKVEQAWKSETSYPVNRTEVKLDGIWGGGTSYPGKPSCSDAKGCHNALENLSGNGDPEPGGDRRWQICVVY